MMTEHVHAIDVEFADGVLAEVQLGMGMIGVVVDAAVGAIAEAWPGLELRSCVGIPSLYQTALAGSAVGRLRQCAILRGPA
jgi:hypothetical protein